MKYRCLFFQKIQDISVDEKRNNLQAEMAELKSVNHRLSEIMTRLAGKSFVIWELSFCYLWIGD